MNKMIPILFIGSQLLVSCGLKVSGTVKEEKTSSNSLQNQNDKIEEASKLSLVNTNPEALEQDVNDLLTFFENLYKKEDSHEGQELDLRKPKYVKFSDIKQWRAAGDEHAAGYDADGKLLAMYDLTYQNTLSPEFMGRSILGTVGVGDFNLREIIKIIMNELRQKQSDSEETLDGKSSPMSKDDFKKVIKVLQNIDEKYGDAKNPLTGEWWKQIPIKKDENGNLVADPNVGFKLSDIDFESMMSHRQKWKFQREQKKLLKDISEIFNIDATNLFDQLTFKKNGNGSFNLINTPTGNLAPNDRPDKVIDFIRYKSSFGYSLLYIAIKYGLANVAQAIPQPVVAALVKYAVCRWFELYEEQLSFHRFKAFEFIDAAERAEVSPFSFLNQEERARGGVYVLSHESSIFHTIFKPRNEAYFYALIRQELENIRLNSEWTKSKNINLSSISTLFYFGDDAKTSTRNHILDMGSRPRFGKKPFISINYAHPHRERIKRNFLKSTHDLLQAVNLPIPAVSSLMSILYDVFVMDDIRDAIRWDGRLAAILSTSKIKDFTRELELIYAQRVNPFEFDLDEERIFVQRSKAHLGL